MIEREGVRGVVWDKMKKIFSQPRAGGVEYFGDVICGKKAESGKNWKRRAKEVLSKQIEMNKYYYAQKRYNWEYGWPGNLKFYFAESPNYYAVGWLLKTQTEKSLKKDGVL